MKDEARLAAGFVGEAGNARDRLTPRISVCPDEMRPA